jgi:hypothetical protein
MEDAGAAESDGDRASPLWKILIGKARDAGITFCRSSCLFWSARLPASVEYDAGR